jgi:hypothetical protein
MLDRRSVGSVCLGIKHPSAVYDQICITVRLRVCWCGALSLARGRAIVYNCSWPSPARSFSGPESFGTRDHIFLSQYRDFPFRRLLRLAGLRWRYSILPPRGINISVGQVKVKVTLRLTVSQWVSWPDIYYSLTVTVLFFWGALSDERTGLSFYMLLALASVIFLGSESLSTRDHILLSHCPFPFRRLLRLAGSRWRYSTPPPHGTNRSCQSQSYIATDGQSISKSWCRAPSGTHDQIFITFWRLWSGFLGAPSLTRRRVCLLYMLLALASVVFLGS